MPNTDRQRLAQLCAMTGSDHDGEVLNAIRLANRHLRAAKETWADVIELHPTPPAPPPPRTYEYIPNNWPTRWRWLACAVFDSGRQLDAYETQMIRKIIVYRCYIPSPKQLEWLREIAERVLVKKAAA